MEKQEKNTVTPYDLDGRPPLKLAIPLGLQHVLAMFVGNLTPLLIITAACGIEAGGELQVALLQNAMLIAGIVTLVQVFTKLPAFVSIFHCSPLTSINCSPAAGCH